MIADRSLASISAEDLSELVTASAREGARLEFKRDLYAWNDEGTREFLADVSSFANAQGGLLLIGVDEDDGCARELVGLACSVDAEIQRIEAKIQTGIEPRIEGVGVKAIALSDDRWVIVIRVPQSWSKPHMVTFKNLSRFYSRISSGKYQLDVGGIRGQVLGAETLFERIRGFRIDRLDRAVSNRTELPLEPGAKVVLHAVPYASMAPGAAIVMPDLTATNSMRQPIMSAGYSWRYNFDGLLTFTNRKDEFISTYVQLFRNGIVEAVDCRLLRPWDDKRQIPGAKFETEIMQAVARYASLIEFIGMTAPVAWMLTLIGVKQYSMLHGYSYDSETIDRDVLQVPEVIQDDSSLGYVAISQRLLDPVWQAAGWERSPNFDSDGQWKQPR
jgi:hypothetical protein